MGYDLKWDGLSAADLVNKGLGGNQNVKKARARFLPSNLRSISYVQINTIKNVRVHSKQDQK